MIRSVVDLWGWRLDRAAREIDKCSSLIEAYPRRGHPASMARLDQELERLGSLLAELRNVSGPPVTEPVATTDGARRNVGEAMQRCVRAFDAAYPDLGALRRQATRAPE